MPPRKAPVINAPSPEESLSPAADEITNKKKTKTAEVAKSDVDNPTNAAAVRKMSAHPSTLVMVKEALGANDSRKGSSVQAIRGFILEKYPSVDAVRLKHMLRKALIKGLESGALVRPPNSSGTGAQGRFRLPVKNKPKESKKSVENSDPNARKAPETEAPVKGKAEGSDKPKPATKKPKAKPSKDSMSPEDSGSKVAPVKKPKAKKLAGEKKQEAKVLKPVQTRPSEAGEDRGAPAGKNPKRGKMKDYRLEFSPLPQLSCWLLLLRWEGGEKEEQEDGGQNNRRGHHKEGLQASEVKSQPLQSRASRRRRQSAQLE